MVHTVIYYSPITAKGEKKTFNNGIKTLNYFTLKVKEETAAAQMLRNYNILRQPTATILSKDDFPDEQKYQYAIELAQLLVETKHISKSNFLPLTAKKYLHRATLKLTNKINKLKS